MQIGPLPLWDCRLSECLLSLLVDGSECSREQGRSDGGLSRLNMTENCVKKSSFFRSEPLARSTESALVGSIYLVFFHLKGTVTNEQIKQCRRTNNDDEVERGT